MVTTSLYPKAQATESGFGPPSDFSPPFLAWGGGGEKRGEGGVITGPIQSGNPFPTTRGEDNAGNTPDTSIYPTPLSWMPVVSGIFPPLFLGIGALVLIDNSTLRGNLPVGIFLAVSVWESTYYIQVFSTRPDFFPPEKPFSRKIT